MKVFELIAEYQSSYLIYKELAAKLESLFEKLLVSKNSSFLQIETRVKSLPSFLDKVYRLISANKNLDYIFNDLVGIRLITYYNEDVYQITELIENNFEIHSKNSEYESHKRAPDQFGYSSIHYKVSLSPDKNYSTELTKFQGIIFEVQVRTVVQHAWAAIDHKIRYKTAEKIPHVIQRQIFQLSALFELADSQFLSIKKNLETQAREDLGKYKKGDLSVNINALNLEYFFETHKTTVQAIVDKAQETGFKETTLQNDPNSIRYLLMLFHRVGVVSMAELEELFEKVREKGPAIMEKVYQVVSNKNIISIDYPFPILLLVIIVIRLRVTQFNEIDINQVILHLQDASEKSMPMSGYRNKNLLS